MIFNWWLKREDICMLNQELIQVFFGKRRAIYVREDFSFESPINSVL